MSLINEALKKAQRSRHPEATEAGGAADPAGTSVARRPQPRSAKSLLLLVAGAVILVVASMVFTALWLTRPSPAATASTVHPAHPASAETKAAAAPSPARPSGPAATTAASTPVAAGGTTSTSAAAATPGVTAPGVPAEAAAAITRAADAKTEHPATVVATPEPAVVSTAATPPPAAAAPVAAPEPKPDERIHQFVESIKVTGIRSSGNDSKVLMNDRVYRVNDIVERTLNVRLTKVSRDSLTFTDANGVTYVKFF